MTFDTFSGKLILYGDSHITMIDPSNPSVVFSDLFAGGLINSNLDQGTTDGKGHLLVADNGGKLVFVDYKATGQVGTATFAGSQFLANFLDDVAPLSGLGSSVPEPGTVVFLVASGLVATLRLRRRK